MNLFNWRTRIIRPESRSPNVGDDLAQLIADYYLESSRWPRTRGEEIRESALTLMSVRDDLMTGDMSDDDAAIWVDAGWTILEEYRRERSIRNHPSGKGRR